MKVVERPTQGYRYSRALLIIFFAAAVDVFDLLDRSSRGGPIRYGLLLIPVIAVIAIRPRGSTLIRRPRPHEWALLALFLFGIVGTTYGIVLGGVTSTARSLFLPMLIALLAVLIVEPMNEEEAHKLLRAMAWIATIYIVLAAIAYSGLIGRLLEFRQFKNATFPYVAMGLSAAYLLKRRWWTAGLAAGAFVIWSGYASATSSLILVMMVIVFLATSPKASRARPYVMGIAILLAAAIAIANFGTSTEVANSYFTDVGKANTSAGRLEFWADGIATWETSPLIGHAFASNIVVEAGRAHASPYHNDFILFLAEGGLVGAGLLVAWIVLLLVDLTKRYFAFAHANAPNRANLARLLLVGLTGFFVSMAFNPVLEGLSRSATIFALAAIAAMLGTPEQGEEQTTEQTGATLARTPRAPVSATTPAGRGTPVR